jgi:hypothetical protein
MLQFKLVCIVLADYNYQAFPSLVYMGVPLRFVTFRDWYMRRYSTAEVLVLIRLAAAKSNSFERGKRK